MAPQNVHILLSRTCERHLGGEDFANVIPCGTLRWEILQVIGPGCGCHHECLHDGGAWAWSPDGTGGRTDHRGRDEGDAATGPGQLEPQEWDRTRSLQRESGPARSLISARYQPNTDFGFGPPKLRKHESHRFKPPSAWRFVTAASGHWLRRPCQGAVGARPGLLPCKAAPSLCWDGELISWGHLPCH